MIISIDKLRAGIRRWDELNFPADLLNGEYYGVYRSRIVGLTEQWWSSAVDRLGQWKAYRGPSPPNTRYEIAQRGLASLPAIAAEYEKLAGKSTAELPHPSIFGMSPIEFKELHSHACSPHNSDRAPSSNDSLSYRACASGRSGSPPLRKTGQSHRLGLR